MRTASGGLIATLAAGGPYLIADLYTLSLANGGAVYNWTTCDFDLTVAGQLYSSVSNAGVPSIRRGSMRTEAGIAVSTVEITLGVGSIGVQPQIAGMSLPLAASLGYLDGAGIKIDRLFMGPGGWGDVSLGSMPWFYGQVSEPEPSSTAVKLICKSALELLAALQLPRRVFQELCPHSLYSPACGATKAPVAAAVISGAGAPSVIVSDASATGVWTNGTVKFSDGAIRSIVSSTLIAGTNTLVLSASLPSAPAGAATLLLGCDKQWSTCNTTFGRSASFGGFPFIPPPNTVKTP